LLGAIKIFIITTTLFVLINLPFVWIQGEIIQGSSLSLVQDLSCDFCSVIRILRVHINQSEILVWRKVPEVFDQLCFFI